MTTIRRRLTVWYTVALGFSILAFGTLLYWEQRQASIQDLDARLELETELAGRWLAESYRVIGRLTTVTASRLTTVNDSSLTTVTDSTTALEPGVSAYFESLRDYVVVGDTAGRMLALSEATHQLDASALQHFTELVDSVRLRVHSGTIDLGIPAGPLRYRIMPVRNAGPEVGVVVVAIPTAQAAFGPAALVRSMLFIAPLVMIGGLIVGYWLAGQSLRPLQTITDELEAITDGRSLHRRVAAPVSADELRRLVLTMNGMLARLEQSFATLHRFTADASHELKTPLMVLRVGVERSLTHPGTPPEILQVLDDTLAQINRMSEMVESLLTLARAYEGRAPILALKDVDLRALLADVAETAGILGDDVGIVVVVKLPDAPVILPADRSRIREMLLNLVTNAVKYTPGGGTVSLGLVDGEDMVTITVRDTGIGIAPGDLPHIFERFWRADPARSRTSARPGTGLGLAITKWIAEAHGGQIDVQSRPGRGTLFTVTLPKSRPT